MTDEERMADDGCPNEPSLEPEDRWMLDKIVESWGEPTVVDSGYGTTTFTWAPKERRPLGPDDVAEIWGT